MCRPGSYLTNQSNATDAPVWETSRRLVGSVSGKYINKRKYDTGSKNVAKSNSGKTRDPNWYAGTNPGAGNPPKKDWVPSKFVRSELSDQEKEHVKAQHYVWDDIPENLDALVQAGYKVSLTNDLKSNAYAVWITPNAENNPNYGFTLSARGPTLLAALSVAFYKHFTKFDGIWPKDDNTTSRDQWG